MKIGIASFKGTVAEFRKELQNFREFMKFVAEQEGTISKLDLQ